MKPSPELREIITVWFESVGKGDLSWTENYISRDKRVRLVGTDPGEVLAGGEVAAFLSNEAKTVAGIVTAVAGEVEAYEEGTVGWGLAQPTLTLPGGKEVSPRWSAVFHREDGAWKLVQLHASMGITNEELFGMEVAG